MKTILLSIHQRHWNNIKSGKKTCEIRKTKPKDIEYPFKVLCYVTGGVGIVGEFECSATIKTNLYQYFIGSSCLSPKELQNYGKGSSLYGWHVKEDSVAEYRDPIPLSTFGIKRAPQSWQYIK